MPFDQPELDLVCRDFQVVLISDGRQYQTGQVVDAGRYRRVGEGAGALDNEHLRSDPKGDLHRPVPLLASESSEADLIYPKADVLDFVVDEAEPDRQASCSHASQSEKLRSSWDYETYYIGIRHYPSERTTQPDH
jgi:hypothetical protein